MEGTSSWDSAVNLWDFNALVGNDGVTNWHFQIDDIVDVTMFRTFRLLLHEYE